METISDTADCGSCTVPHPYRLHAEGGPCQVALCGCQGFVEATSKVAVLLPRCYLCDRPAHATGACPFVPHRG